jgi:hypothetical protein
MNASLRVKPISLRVLWILSVSSARKVSVTHVGNPVYTSSIEDRPRTFRKFHIYDHIPWVDTNVIPLVAFHIIGTRQLGKSTREELHRLYETPMLDIASKFKMQEHKRILFIYMKCSRGLVKRFFWIYPG